MSGRSPITTHILDTGRGRPAEGVSVRLYRQAGSLWQEIGSGRSDQDGRILNLLDSGTLAQPGLFRLEFDTKAYYEQFDIETFFPIVEITFHILRIEQHYHVPLLLSPYGYTTYRGS